MLKIIYHSGVILQLAIEWIIDHFWAFFIKGSMGHCGKNVMIKPRTSVFKGIENFYIDDDVRIARYAVIYSTRAKVFIGSKTGIAPYLKIITGNHRMNNIGHFMFDGDNNKNPDDDKDVIIEGDSWFGINVTILSGVTIGRGSVIAAGAIVNKSCPPYSIIGGIPAKVLKFRLTIDEVLEHERILYPEDKRYTKEELMEQRKNYLKK
jgi:acetyltransferase-like isoleucine patch superfamily enzyme